MSKPMLDGSFHVKTHTLGYRIPDGADAAAFRPGGLLAIGCSFTFGDEVEAEETFTDVAARALGLAAYKHDSAGSLGADAAAHLRESRHAGADVPPRARSDLAHHREDRGEAGRRQHADLRAGCDRRRRAGRGDRRMPLRDAGRRPPCAGTPGRPRRATHASRSSGPRRLTRQRWSTQ